MVIRKFRLTRNIMGGKPPHSPNTRGMVCETRTYKWQTDTLFIRSSNRNKILGSEVHSPNTKPSENTNISQRPHNEQVGCKTRNLKKKRRVSIPKLEDHRHQNSSASQILTRDDGWHIRNPELWVRRP